MFEMKEKKKVKELSIKKVIIYLLIGLLAIWFVSEDVKKRRKLEAELVESAEENNVEEASAEQEIVELPKVKPGERDVTITKFYTDTIIRKHNDETYEGLNDYTDTVVIVAAIGVDEEGNEIYLDEDKVERFQTDEFAIHLTPENIAIQVGDIIKVALDQYGDVIYAKE
jgi:hypothetical protein